MLIHLNNLKNEKGFTLMEVILSIAILAAISGFILQMFLVSSGLNAKAGSVDIGMTNAMNSIELFKQQEEPEDYFNNAAFDNATYIYSENKNYIFKFFDGNWNVQELQENLVLDDNENIINFNKIPSNIKFVMRVDIFENERSEAGRLCEIAVSVLDIRQPVEKQAVINIKANKYFSF